jgi:hypothetical protein
MAEVPVEIEGNKLLDRRVAAAHLVVCCVLCVVCCVLCVVCCVLCVVCCVDFVGFFYADCKVDLLKLGKLSPQ